MVFPSNGNHLSKEYELERNSQIGKEFGMIASRKRLKRRVRATSREVVKITWLLSMKKRRENERVLARMVTMI
jgi:hypothetical protein